ncbi:hypothetical protein PILCRDRAFT_333260 [Piloderma croceum F 1598]|uniref:Carbohydrate-binding module family 19 domain-containing protein n=1 Tax=Piloderma croceum (strain F 1598) TaxID=765440 RepID=A0A0C3FPF9_PILCF|nr:hypothetical protein PILCRDRAFT_333260 [Piloderma croceum F 1598]
MLVSTFSTAIFLTINHLYSTFASPIASEAGLAAGQSLNLTHALAKRDSDYVPVDQLCNVPEDWLFRNCFSAYLDKVYVDECMDDYEVYWKLGSCPQGTMCMNTFGPPPDYIPTIICLNIPLGPAGNPSGNPPANGQVGYQQVSNAGNAAPVECIVSVELENDVTAGAVSAIIEGNDGNYLVAPNAAMVGSLRDTTAKVCDYNVSNRDCVPTGRYDLQQGNNIDFTFGLGGDQAVRFYYSIIAS